MTRQEAVQDLKEICVTIGCTGMDPDLCLRNPQDCAIIRRVMRKPMSGHRPALQTVATADTSDGIATKGLTVLRLLNETLS